MSHPRAQRTPAATAQDRVLHATAEVVDHVGYAHLTVERILVAARVSRASFYQYYANVDDCFWSAYRHHADQLARAAAAAAKGSEDRELAVLGALARFAVACPSAARLLMREGLAAGPAGLLERDALIARLEDAAVDGPRRPRTVDLPASIMIGGTFRFLAMMLSDGRVLDDLQGPVSEWAAAFPRGSSHPSWSERLAPVLPTQAPSRALARVRLGGDPRVRILSATALAIRAKGYRAITVADIVTAAGVSRRTFYNVFPSKADAFIGAYEHAFQQAMAACTPAFFTARAWPERVWNGGLAFTGFLARDPLLAYLGFVECYAIGPRFSLRVHDTQLAFTLFLEEGYRQRPEAESLSRGCSALAAATIFEIAFQASRRGPRFDMRRCQPLAVYVALAPFIGRDEAGQFVSEKLSRARSSTSTAA